MALSFIRSNLPAATSASLTNVDPKPTATAPASKYSCIVSIITRFVGIKSVSGKAISFQGLKDNALFREIGVGVLVSLIPEDQLGRVANLEIKTEYSSNSKGEVKQKIRRTIQVGEKRASRALTISDLIKMAFGDSNRFTQPLSKKQICLRTFYK